jgi:hypothetical protein
MPIPTLVAARTAKPRLTGKYKTRAAARIAYGLIADELGCCEDSDQLEAYLCTIAEDIEQFRLELDHWWSGDGADFIGLEAEIANARARVIDSGIWN